MTYQPRPGDIGLSGVKAQGVVSLAIRLGSVLRHDKLAGRGATLIFVGLPLAVFIEAVVRGITWWVVPAVLVAVLLAVFWVVLWASMMGFRDRNKQWFSHSFIVHHVDPAGRVVITESHAKGVETRPLHYPPGEFVWLKTSVLLSGDDEAEMRAFLDAVTAARWKYDYWTFAGLALYSICGAMLVPPTVGTAICSGLTSEALTRGKAIWPLPAYRMMPQDQWWAALNQGIETVETG